MKLQVYYAGTDRKENAVYWVYFGWKEKVPFEDVECLDGEEIGQLMGGN